MELPKLDLRLADDARASGSGYLDGSGWSVATGKGSTTGATSSTGTSYNLLPLALVGLLLVGLAVYARRGR